MVSSTLLTTHIIICLCVFAVSSKGSIKKLSSPPHCTQVTKDSDYIARYKLDYPVAYIMPGQQEAYQKLYCVSPAAVHRAVSAACDWAAPPLVAFELEDGALRVRRQDPAGRFPGRAVVTTLQLCAHAGNYSRAAPVSSP